MDDYLKTGGVSTNLEILAKPPSTVSRFPSSINAKHKDDLFLKGYGRQWGEKLTYSVGLAYGSGLCLGGSYGFLLGLRRGGVTPKLFLNSILNSCSINGPALANKCAVITMFFCGFNNLTQMLVGDDRLSNSSIAGCLSGALFKCTGGVKQIMKYSLVSSALFTGVDYLFRRGYI